MTTLSGQAVPLLDQVAAIDAVAVAARVVTGGTRGAIQASSVEILAMALLLGQLTAIADRTYDLFAVADRLQVERDPTTRSALRVDVLNQIAQVGAALEALGYGQSPTIQPQESH